MHVIHKYILGDFYLDELFKMSKIDADSVEMNLFNDDCEDKPVFRREHMIHFEVLGIFGCSNTMFTAEQRAWSGKSDICLRSKSKRKMEYAGRDISDTIFSENVIDPETMTYKGTRQLPTKWPSTDEKLYPIDAPNRTIIG